MADSFYQIPTTPKLYVSYPLFQYANGALDDVDVYESGSNALPDENYISMIQLDPSKQHTYDIGDYYVFKQKIVPTFDNDTDVISSGLWNFDFAMFLGHNFNSANVSIDIHALQQDEAPSEGNSILGENIVNNNTGEPPEFDGWSLVGLNSNVLSDSRFIHFGLSLSMANANIKLNSLLFGKTFTFPQNADLSATTKFDYGVKQKTTSTGKTISTVNWGKTDNWITEPFGLGDQIGDNFQRRSGRRIWNISFDSLAPDKVMPQNMMMNSNGFSAQDNHSVAADGTSSLYNINNSEDFFSSVLHKSLGGHNPMVLQINKDDYSPSNFAIVRLQSDYVVTQKTPNLYNIKCTFVEQI